jgi:hypothetical protein
MTVEKVSNHSENQSTSGNNYFIELGFFRLGDILYQIAISSEKLGGRRPLDYEGENVESNTEH